MGACWSASLKLLSDDQLYSLLAEADEAGDDQLFDSLWMEVQSRCQYPPETVHQVPLWLARLLPRAVWHQKPTKTSGGGEGLQ